MTSLNFNGLKTLSLVLREEGGMREFENGVLRIFNSYKKKRGQERGEEENYRVRDLRRKRTMETE